MASPVTHFEINSSDGPALGKFYGELFGWHLESFDIPDGGGGTYEMVDTHAGSGINGGIATTMPGGTAYVTVYAEADDIQATLNKATSLGATVALPVSKVGDMVTIAIFIDPQGNAVGLTQANPQAAEMGGVSGGSNAAVDWFEILGPDGKALRKFYRELFGWEISENMGGEGIDYGEVNAEGRGIGGGIGASQTGGPATTVYAHVDDLDKYLERAETLGAKKIMGPMDMGNVSIAQFADPQGNVFGLYRSSQ